VDRVEFLYTRFINLITSEPSIRTVLPLKAQGIEDQADEIFSLTTDNGQLMGEKTVRACVSLVDEWVGGWMDGCGGGLPWPGGAYRLPDMEHKHG
jgi:hypothetical protein